MTREIESAGFSPTDMFTALSVEPVAEEHKDRALRTFNEGLWRIFWTVFLSDIKMSHFHFVCKLFKGLKDGEVTEMDAKTPESAATSKLFF